MAGELPRALQLPAPALAHSMPRSVRCGVPAALILPLHACVHARHSSATPACSPCLLPPSLPLSSCRRGSTSGRCRTSWRWHGCASERGRTSLSNRFSFSVRRQHFCLLVFRCACARTVGQGLCRTIKERQRHSVGGGEAVSGGQPPRPLFTCRPSACCTGSRPAQHAGQRCTPPRAAASSRTSPCAPQLLITLPPLPF